VPNDVHAIGNTWEPDEEGADAEGSYPAATTFSASAESCPHTSLSEIDTAWDEQCENGFTKEEGYQNFIIEDGSCEGGKASEVGVIIVSE
jgi:hypothetical protein